MFLQEWFEKHNISQEAIHEFKYQVFKTELDARDLERKIIPQGSTEKIFESSLQHMIRLEASNAGARLWRNNVGCTYTNNGGFIRYGLANDSKKENSILKSSDLVGIKPIKITQEMIGKVIGQFLCREIKIKGWRYSQHDTRSNAQLAWINLINTLGGDAAFTSGIGSL